MKRLRLFTLALLLSCSFASGQSTELANPGAAEIVRLFGLEPQINALHALEASRGQGPVVLEELVLRQELSEKITAASLDVDSVIAELSNEQADLGTIRTELQMKRDKKVSRLTTAALLTGSALGSAVSATQFTTLSSRTQNVGDALGIGSGVASTVLSVLAAKAQTGPSGSVGRTPNMLAPLLDDTTPALGTAYPSTVLAYLHSTPPLDKLGAGTRLEQLMTSWGNAGRLANRSAVTTSGGTLKVTISDLNDRIAMLGDVRGRVALIKRDLAALVRSLLICDTVLAH